MEGRERGVPIVTYELLNETNAALAKTLASNSRIMEEQQREISRLSRIVESLSMKAVSGGGMLPAGPLGEAKRQVSYAAVVESGRPDVTAADIMSTLKKRVKSAELGVAVQGVHQGVGKVIVKCRNKAGNKN